METNIYFSQRNLPDSVATLLALQHDLTMALSHEKPIQLVDSDTASLRKQNDHLRKQLYRITTIVEGLNIGGVPKNFTSLRE